MSCSTHPARSSRAPIDYWDLHETSSMVGAAQPKYGWMVKWTVPGRALDLGCNDGTFTQRLADNGINAIGADRFHYVRTARQRYAVPCVALDAECPLPFVESCFDTVIISGVLEYLTAPTAVL